ncbi:MAG: hypothetical protein KDE27_12805 [Planctomycetes bacterium]|nr:hypothetical protein [Planctomycetota bacterium]
MSAMLLAVEILFVVASAIVTIGVLAAGWSGAWLAVCMSTSTFAHVVRKRRASRT